MFQWNGNTGSQAILVLNNIRKIDVTDGVLCLHEVFMLLQPVLIRLQAKENDLVAT